MFRRGKDLGINSRSLLKNKDARSLRAKILERFPNVSEDQLKVVFPSKASIDVIKLASRALVYVNVDTGTPIFFDVNGRGNLYPTVYTLWEIPALAPFFVVHCPVSQYVLGGADVMLPGVVRRCTDLQSLRKGECRSVVGNGNPAPFAVGEILLDAQYIEANGMKGKGLKVLHHCGDELWAMGPQTVLNEGFTTTMVVALDTEEDGREEEEDHQDDPTAENVEEEGKDDHLDQEGGAEVAKARALEDDLEEISLSSESVPIARSEFTEEEMDHLLEKSLFQALKKYLKDKDLPMLVNVFWAKVMIPARPPGSTLDLKRSSYKKLSKFLATMSKRGVLAVEEKGGVQSVIAVNRAHADYRAHTIYSPIPIAPPAEAENQTSHQKRPSAALNLDVVSLYRPTTYIRPVLKNEEGDLQFSPLFTAKELRDALGRYIKREGLESQENRRFIRLDPALTEAIYRSGKTQMQKPEGGDYPRTMARDELFAKILSRMQEYHALSLHSERGKGEKGEYEIRAGKVQPIVIETKRVSGNKKVTHVRNLEKFGISPAELSHEAQKKFACSSGVQPLPGKGRGEEVLIQGDRGEDIVEYLGTRYNIPSKYIEEMAGKGCKK